MIGRAIEHFEHSMCGMFELTDKFSQSCFQVLLLDESSVAQIGYNETPQYITIL